MLCLLQTSSSCLVFATVNHKLDDTSYDAITRPQHAQHNFLAGPGESLPLRSISLVLEGIIRVEGTLLR